MELKDQLLSIAESVTHLLPELILIASLVITLVLGLILKKNKQAIIHTLAVITYLIAIVIIIQTWPKQPVALFGGMMRLDDFSAFFKLLFLSGGILTILISTKRKDDTAPEFIVLLDAIILGSCLLASSMNFVMVLLSLELVSLSSYMLAGFGFDKKSFLGRYRTF